MGEMARYWKLFKITMSVALIQLVGGAMVAESLTNQADGGHGSTDGVTIAVSIIVARQVFLGWNERTVRRIGAIVNLAILFGTGGFVWHEACLRFENPELNQELHAGWMTAFALIGVIGGTAQFAILQGVTDAHHETHWLQKIHTSVDLLLSVVATAGGVRIVCGESPIVDAWVATLTAAVIFLVAAIVVAQLITHWSSENLGGHNH